jgi:hypothetical protein
MLRGVRPLEARQQRDKLLATFLLAATPKGVTTALQDEDPKRLSSAYSTSSSTVG